MAKSLDTNEITSHTHIHTLSSKIINLESIDELLEQRYNIKLPVSSEIEIIKLNYNEIIVTAYVYSKYKFPICKMTHSDTNEETIKFVNGLYNVLDLLNTKMKHSDSNEDSIKFVNGLYNVLDLLNSFEKSHNPAALCNNSYIEIAVSPNNDEVTLIIPNTFIDTLQHELDSRYKDITDEPNCLLTGDINEPDSSTL